MTSSLVFVLVAKDQVNSHQIQNLIPINWLKICQPSVSSLISYSGLCPTLNETLPLRLSVI